MRHWSLQISLCTDGAPSPGRHGQHGLRIDLQPVAALLGGLLPVDGGVGDLVFVEPVEHMPRSGLVSREPKCAHFYLPKQVNR